MIFGIIMIIFLLQIVQNFEFECLNQDEIQANTSQVLVPNKDIKLAFSIRKPEIRE